MEKLALLKADIINKAIETLQKHKGLPLELHDFTQNIFNVDAYYIRTHDTEIDEEFTFSIPDDIFNAQRLDSESQTLIFDDIVMLRIARHIFEEYKRLRKQWDDDHLCNVNAQTISSSLNCGASAYDISLNNRSLTATFDEIDELKDKLQKLKDEKEDLTKQLDSLKAVVDILLARCQDKGIL